MKGRETVIKNSRIFKKTDMKSSLNQGSSEQEIDDQIHKESETERSLIIDRVKDTLIKAFSNILKRFRASYPLTKSRKKIESDFAEILQNLDPEVISKRASIDYQRSLHDLIEKLHRDYKQYLKALTASLKQKISRINQFEENTRFLDEMLQKCEDESQQISELQKASKKNLQENEMMKKAVKTLFSLLQKSTNFFDLQDKFFTPFQDLSEEFCSENLTQRDLDTIHLKVKKTVEMNLLLVEVIKSIAEKISIRLKPFLKINQREVDEALADPRSFQDFSQKRLLKSLDEFYSEAETQLFGADLKLDQFPNPTLHIEVGLKKDDFGPITSDLRERDAEVRRKLEEENALLRDEVEKLRLENKNIGDQLHQEINTRMKIMEDHQDVLENLERITTRMK